jgi:hypothetical protein
VKPVSAILNYLNSHKKLADGLIIGLAAILALLLPGIFSGQLSWYNLGLLLLVLGGTTAVLSITFWQQAFFIVIMVLTFEGMVRNLTNQVTVLLLKDLLLGFVYLGYLIECGRAFQKEPKFRRLLQILFALFLFIVVQLANPNLASPLIGLVGLKTLLFYIPLLFIAYEVLDSAPKIIIFSIFTVILADISGAFGLVQYVLGVDFISIFQPEGVMAAVGENGIYYKLPGTFASPGNFASFMIVGFTLAMGLLYSKTSPVVKLFSLFSIFNLCLVLLLANHRATWVFVLLCFFLGAFLRTANTFVKLVRLGLALLLILAFINASTSTNNIVGDRLLQFTNGDGLQGYLIDAPIGQLNFTLTNGGFLGKGIGAAAPGARYLWSDFQFIESFYAALLYELGPLGLLLEVSLLFTVLLNLVMAFFRLKTSGYRPIVFFIILLLLDTLVLSLTYAPIQIPPLSHYFWILPGVVLRLQRMQLQNQPDEFKDLKPLILTKLARYGIKI